MLIALKLAQKYKKRNKSVYSKKGQTSDERMCVQNVRIESGVIVKHNTS